MATTSPKLRVFPPEWEEEIRKDPHWPENVLFLQVALARLGYFKRPFVPEMDERTVAAFQEYKRDAGLPPGDAIIDRPLMKRMEDDADALVEPIGLMPYSFQDLGDHLFIVGTWRGVGQGIASPEQSSEIQCIKQLGVCFEAMAKLTEDHGLLSSMAIVHTIDRWTDSEITTVGDHAACAYWTTRFNRVTKTVSRTRTTTSTEGMCAPIQGEDFHIQLSDGQEVARELRQEFIARQRKVLGLPETGL